MGNVHRRLSIREFMLKYVEVNLWRALMVTVYRSSALCHGLKNHGKETVNISGTNIHVITEDFAPIERKRLSSKFSHL